MRAPGRPGGDLVVVRCWRVADDGDTSRRPRIRSAASGAGGHDRRAARHGGGGHGATRHRTAPSPEDDWREWFLENARSFRRTLLRRRDGARLHAGSAPTGDLGRIRHKMAFLVASGVPEQDAQMAMLAAGRYTVGCVLGEQADTGPREDLPADVPVLDHETAFEAGLALILGGLQQHTAPHGGAPRPARGATMPNT
ncbi:TetR/AcrR family transcriptional regulator C-terminal domain-containing protein [Streptomyces sp. NPDC050095]|uniref:TetR/AcrR family transcriptional regulator C-terminal domain-containing protein n=1 Tax=unclassified Streptomyces TaxID=2593676 RepID=UPI0034322411